MLDAIFIELITIHAMTHKLTQTYQVSRLGHESHAFGVSRFPYTNYIAPMLIKFPHTPVN